jgi:hypothetical protein
MAKQSDIRRLRTDEFPSKYRDLTDKLVYGINQFFESTYNALNKRLTFADNFQAMDIEVSVNTPVDANNTVSFKNTLGVPIRGVIIRRVDNNTDSTALTAAPFVEFENGTNQVTITNIVGLADNKTYTLRLLCES